MRPTFWVWIDAIPVFLTPNEVGSRCGIDQQGLNSADSVSGKRRVDAKNNGEGYKTKT